MSWEVLHLNHHGASHRIASLRGDLTFDHQCDDIASKQCRVLLEQPQLTTEPEFPSLSVCLCRTRVQVVLSPSYF
jgi:hypothetical protein